AIRLGVAGHDVTLLERNPELGGKLAARSVDGFTFDTGPSLLTLPHVFDELLALTGTSLAEAVDLVRLDPICRYSWPGGAPGGAATFDHRADRGAAVAAVEAGFPGAGEAFDAWLAHARTIWEVAERSFFAGPLESPVALLQRMQRPGDLLAIDPLRTLSSRARRVFDDPRLVQWAGRYATYSGSSPERTPATLACIPWIEQAFGAWYVRGGLAVLAGALEKAMATAGVEVRTGADVEAIRADATSVRGLRLAGGEVLDADVVVANVDAIHLYGDLLPDPRMLRRTLRATLSSSGFALLLGVEGGDAGARSPAHHEISFAADGPSEFRQIFSEGRAPTDPTIYLCNTSVTDPGAAPPGCEAWFVLVNVPPAGTVDWDREADRYRDQLLDLLATRGFDVAGRTRVCEVVTPLDIASRTRSWQGSIYGTSSNGRRAAFLRPSNRGPKQGLYLAGGSAHPGGGLPLVAMSGRIVADMVAADGWPT
ncbi:MAG: phytoene desaturase family protein, partial [Acidimicrobiales bacterium]